MQKKKDVDAFNNIKKAKNSVSDGKSSDKILKSIVIATKPDKLKISILENIPGLDVRELLKIDNEIFVFQYEEFGHGSKIFMAFAYNNSKLPHLNL